MSTVSANIKQLKELRLLSGLSWNQIAELFGVARQQAHYWASGADMSEETQLFLSQLLETVKWVDRGTTRKNREVFSEDVLVLLKAGDFEKVREKLGKGDSSARKPYKNQRHVRSSSLPLESFVFANHESLPHKSLGSKGISFKKEKK